MARSLSSRTALVLGVGIFLSGLAGALAAPVFGARAGMVWTGLLLYVFALSYASNRLQAWLARSPFAPWKAAVLGIPVFIPMFLGWFPVSNWLMGTSATTHYRAMPSPLWIMAVMFWGLIAPGGAVLDGLRRLRSRWNPPIS